MFKKQAPYHIFKGFSTILHGRSICRHFVRMTGDDRIDPPGYTSVMQIKGDRTGLYILNMIYTTLISLCSPLCFCRLSPRLFKRIAPETIPPPTMVHILGTSLMPKMGRETQTTPPTTSTREIKFSSAAVKCLAPRENRIKPTPTNEPWTILRKMFRLGIRSEPI